MKYGKLLRTLSTALILSLLMLVLPATTVFAAAISVYPSSGTVGTSVIVSGSNFSAGARVDIYFPDTATFQTYAYTDNVGYFTAQSFTIPQLPAGTKTIYVRDGVTLNYAVTNFTIVPDIVLNKLMDYVGSQVTVSGTGFSADQNVSIYFDEELLVSTTTSSSGTFSNTTFTVPPSSTGIHTVKAMDSNGNYDSVEFTTRHSMSINPTSGTVSSKVTVLGNGFLANRGIIFTFDSLPLITSPASVVANSKGTFNATFDVPGSAGGAHEISATDGTSTATQSFTTLPSIKLNLTSGYVGTKVNVSGTGFLANLSINITFDNELIKIVTSDSLGAFSYSFNVPIHSAGTYKVKATDGVNTKEADFTISTDVDITPITSITSPGNVGDTITISGVGFSAGKTLKITYDGQQVATGTVDSDGAFTLTFSAPASRAGEHTIIATDGLNSIPRTFVIEATPPAIPKPLKPANGSKARSQAVFDWDDVVDPSGITYNLQISTSENFTQESIVLEKTALTKAEYTLTKQESLKSVSKKNPYYWRVRAIDGAFNESGWTGPGSFYVGFVWSLPAWSIYLLIALGVLIIGIFGFWLGRRSTSKVDNV
jgi:hypothetical protein